jgi:HD-GYP domain-containing protein (c-di-GMP phosphodiesterase class II)
MPSPHLTPPPVRLAEVVASVCLATDLAMGQPLEHGLRRALLAVWLGREIGLSDAELADVYYVALLGTVGCAVEGAAMAGYVKDDIAFGEQISFLDASRAVQVGAFILRKVGEGEPIFRRARKIGEVARMGPSHPMAIGRDVALQIGDYLDLGATIREAVGQCQENWNGSGGPQHLKGEAISLPARLYLLAQDAEVFHRTGGIEGAVAVVRRRSGSVYDPSLADRFCKGAPAFLTSLQTATPWDAVLAAEPAPRRYLASPQLDDVVRAISNFIDMRSAHTLGHSPAVAGLAERAARGLGLSPDEVTAVRQAGLLHDIGRMGVPVAVWDKRAPLSDAEWERMKRHPSLTELVLARSNALGHLGTLAGLHHERLDGSGYRGVSAASLPVTARILAAADTYQTNLEPRPHRDQATPQDAARALRRLVDEGKLDGEVVSAMLAGPEREATPRKAEKPAGLSEREVEVLALAVRGLSNREMAERLVVSPKTIGHHVESIYAKIGVSTRVGATLFALQHGLLEQTS